VASEQRLAERMRVPELLLARGTSSLTLTRHAPASAATRRQ
jgi:hypothetical protein